MEIKLEPTDRIVQLNGVAVRLWQGYSGAGVPVVAYIARVMIPKDADGSEFDLELIETAAPRPEVMVIPTRLVL